jgi:hypothetical protein
MHLADGDGGRGPAGRLGGQGWAVPWAKLSGHPFLPMASCGFKLHRASGVGRKPGGVVLTHCCWQSCVGRSALAGLQNCQRWLRGCCMCSFYPRPLPPASRSLVPHPGQTMAGRNLVRCCGLLGGASRGWLTGWAPLAGGVDQRAGGRCEPHSQAGGGRGGGGAGQRQLRRRSGQQRRRCRRR